jgi:peptidoglycan hydrolase-like protein with peptidoglycan-binding domain
MHVIRILCSLLVICTLAACALSQVAKSPSAPSTAQLSASQPPAVELPPSAPTAALEEGTIDPPPAITPTQPASARATSAQAPTPMGAARVLMLQEPALHGEDVRAVQQRLLELGYSQVGTVDGIFGPQTAAAVSAFQRTNGLDVDGVVGPQTRDQLVSRDAMVAVVPIVVHDDSSFLLGGVQEGTWLAAPAAAPLLWGGERYRVLSNHNTETTAIGSKPNQIEVICTKVYTVSLEPAVSDLPVVAVGGNWPLQPRTPRELATNDLSLGRVVATFLQGKGIQQPDVHLTRAIAIDLEGDASDEVVMTATRLSTQDQDPTSVASGDYAFVAVQKTIDGTPRMLELAGNYFLQADDRVAPHDYRVLHILDLNGDWTLEVVVTDVRYEGRYTSAFGVEGTTARTLLTTGCGV